MIKLNSKGFSLVEVLVAAGMVGVIGLGVMSLTKQSSESAKSLEVNTEMVTVLNEMRAILSDPTNCKKTFDGKNAASSATPVDSLIYVNKSGTDVNKFETITRNPNAKYGQGRIKILEYALDDSGAGVDVASEETTNLVVTFDRGKGISGNQTISKNIKLWVDVSAGGNIQDCRSISATANLIWTRSNVNQNDIFYSGGQVGIGINDPTAGFQLDVEGNARVSETMKIGDKQAIGKDIDAAGPPLDVAGEIRLQKGNKVCNNGLEGAIRYNDGPKRMEFCDGNSWRQMGGGNGISCDWNGVRWVSQGYDAAGAWSSGNYIDCQGGQVISIKAVGAPYCPGGAGCQPVP